MPSPCVCTTFRKASRVLHRHYEKAMSDAEVSVVQFAILRSLQRNGPTPLSRIADEQCMERTSLYRTIAPLVEKGAVNIASADTGKARIGTLTAEGESLIEQATPYWRAAQRDAVSVFGARDWRSMASAILELPEQLD